MRTSIRLLRLASWPLALLLAACGTSTPPVPSAAPRSLIDLAQARGFTAPEIDLVKLEGGGLSERYAMRWGGVKVLGVGGKGGAAPAFTRVRLELAQPPTVRPSIREEAAETLALEAFAPAPARLQSLELWLKPTLEDRLKGDVSGRAPTATDFEQVITALTPVWLAAVETTPESASAPEPWAVELDASTGAVRGRWLVALHQKLPPSPLPDGGTLGLANLQTLFHGATRARVLFEDDGIDPPTWKLVDVNGNRFFAKDLFIYKDEDGTFGDGLAFTGGTNVKTLGTDNGQTAAADAVVSVDVVWRMFRNVLGRAGPDGWGRPMPIRLHTEVANAQYMPSLREVQVGYDSLTANPRIPLSMTDVLGHELGHDFFTVETVLDPVGMNDITATEFLALNHGTGDVIGTSAEFYGSLTASGGTFPPPPINAIPNTGGNLTMGEQTGHVQRSLLSPAYPVWSPDLKYQTNVYGLMGPVTREFVLLAFGVKARNGINNGDPWTSARLEQGVAGVGMTKALQIWHDMVLRLPEGGDFATARELAIESAFDRYGFGSLESKAVGDTYAAVNIGLPADRTPPTVVASAVQKKLGMELTVAVDDPVTIPVTSNTSRPHTAFIELASGLPLPLSGQGGTVTVLLDNFVSGLNTVTVRATDSWGNTTTKALPFNVDKTPPTLVATVSGPGKTPTITVSANDASGVAHVAFSRAGVPLCDDASAPFTCQLDTSTWTDGSHPITVKGWDVFDNANQISVNVEADNTAPTAQLTVTGAVPPFTLTATGTDVHPISQVQFTLDGTPFATDSSAPFTAGYAPQDASNHVLYARVSDSFGNVGVASATAPKDTQPPSVTATATQWGYGVTFNGTVGDSCGIAFPVKASVNGTYIGDIGASPFSFALPTALFFPGTHQLAVDATDKCGNTRHFSLAFDIYINVPGVAVTVDATNKKKPILNVQVTHNRPLSSIEIWRGQALVKTVSSPPNNAAITLDTSVGGWPDGTVDVQVIAIDHIGIPGNTHVNVQVDNTKPTCVTSWTANGRNITFQPQVSDGFGSGIVEVKTGILNFVPLAVRQPPYTLPFFVPTAFSQLDLLYSAYVKDAFGNLAQESFVVRVKCTFANGVESCTHQQMSL